MSETAKTAVLLETCGEACDTLSTMVGTIYDMVSADGSKARLQQRILELVQQSGTGDAWRSGLALRAPILIAFLRP